MHLAEVSVGDNRVVSKTSNMLGEGGLAFVQSFLVRYLSYFQYKL